MVDRSSESRVLAQESGLRVVLTLISGSRVFALEPEISVDITNDTLAAKDPKQHLED